MQERNISHCSRLWDLISHTCYLFVFRIHIHFLLPSDAPLWHHMQCFPHGGQRSTWHLWIMWKALRDRGVTLCAVHGPSLYHIYNTQICIYVPCTEVHLNQYTEGKRTTEEWGKQCNRAAVPSLNGSQPRSEEPQLTACNRPAIHFQQHGHQPFTLHTVPNVNVCSGLSMMGTERWTWCIWYVMMEGGLKHKDVCGDQKATAPANVFS